MLMRFDPFRELDRLSEELWGDNRRRGVRPMAMDAYRMKDHFVVHFDLPGVNPESIDITVEDNVLNVTARRAWERSDDQQWLVSERYEGAFHRQLFLGDTLDAERIDAGYDNGVLTLTIPVAEAAKPKKIEVGKGKKAIDASSKAA